MVEACIEVARVWIYRLEFLVYYGPPKPRRLVALDQIEITLNQRFINGLPHTLIWGRCWLCAICGMSDLKPQPLSIPEDDLKTCTNKPLILVEEALGILEP